MLTKPPCFNNGKDCPRRYIGCRASCDDWHKWLAVHAEEKGREREIKAKSLDADVFLFNQGKRIQQARHREYMREYMKDYGKGNERGKNL